mgnify:CR=1 FL=1
MQKIVSFWLIGYLLALVACAGNQSHERDTPIVLNKAVWNDFNQALSLLKEEKYADAIPLLDNVIAKERRFPAPYINLGSAHAKLGHDKLAEENFLLALKIDPVNSHANNELGLLLRKLGRFDDAKKAYETALSKHPDYLPGRKNLGVLCDIYLRDLACAMKHFKKYQKYSPDDQQVKIWIADLERRVAKQ